MKCWLLLLLMVAVDSNAQPPDTSRIHRLRQGELDRRRFRFPQQNQAPKANAGPDQIITLPANSVTLSGSGTDPDGRIIQFMWIQVSGPSDANIVSPRQPQTVVDNLVQGVYQFGLRVMDNHEAIGWDTVMVTVNAIPSSLPNQTPVANAGPDQIITLPSNSVTLSGSGTDPDGKIIQFMWIQISGPSDAHIVSPGQSQTVVDSLVHGVYQFGLRVMDNYEAMGWDTVMVTVNATPPPKPNQPPVADAGPDQSITLPVNTVTLNGSGTDPDGRIIAYNWKWVSGPTHPYIRSPLKPQTVVDSLVQGVYEFELTVMDNLEATGSDTVIVTVNPSQLVTPQKSKTWIIIIGLIGLVAVTSTIYVIWWRRQTKKIIVFFMHPDEKELVQAIMPGSDKTEGFAVGHCPRSKIRLMKKKGLAILLLNTAALTINTPGNTRRLNYSFRKGVPRLKSDTRSPNAAGNFKNLVTAPTVDGGTGFPAYYIITLDTPLLPVFREQLEATGTSIIQYIPSNSYVILVTAGGQLEKLQDKKEFGFIRVISPYTAADTGFIVREEHYEKRRQPAPDAKLMMDLILHREEDTRQVQDFLGQNRIDVVGSYKNTIRIRLSAAAKLEYKLASNHFIQAIYEYMPPVLYNDIARQLIGIDGGTPVVNYIMENGDGEIVAVADTGIDRDHPDLKAHIIETVAWGRKDTNDTTDPHGHGTHVTGSIVGDGVASGGQVKGMAPGASIYFQSVMDETGALSALDLQLPEIFKQAYLKGARIHNNSWGSATASRYTFDSSVVDQFVYENPQMLIVISAGNEATSETHIKNEKGYVGFRSIGSPASTKNGLTVGASRNKRTSGGFAASTYGKIWPEKFPDNPTSNEMVSGDTESLAAYSSRGPCDDNRMKPDIVAPGTDILSTKSNLAPLSNFHGGYQNNAYAFLGGTSMAAPIVSGAAAIVREYYRKKRNYSTPSAALIKATLINGTHKLTGSSSVHGSNIIPNPNQGFGMLDLLSTIPNEQYNFKLEFRDSLQDPSIAFSITGQEYALQLRTKQKTWIRVCLAYTDYPARSIQNDLDLVVDYEPTRQKWSGNLGINAKDPFPYEEDRTNNMEIVRIDQAEPGLYTIKVFAYNLPRKESQGFALVVTTGDLSSEII